MQGAHVAAVVMSEDTDDDADDAAAHSGDVQTPFFV